MSDHTTSPLVNPEVGESLTAPSKVQRELFQFENFDLTDLNNVPVENTIITDWTVRPEFCRDPVVQFRAASPVIVPESQVTLPFTPQQVMQQTEVQKKKPRFSYSKKKLIGDYTLFSKNGYQIPGIEGYLIGEILQCPNKQKNNSQYEIYWCKNSFPITNTNDTALLQTWFSSSTEQSTKKIRRAIERYYSLPANQRDDLRQLPVPDALSTANEDTHPAQVCCFGEYSG